MINFNYTAEEYQKIYNKKNLFIDEEGGFLYKLKMNQNTISLYSGTSEQYCYYHDGRRTKFCKIKKDFRTYNLMVVSTK